VLLFSAARAAALVQKEQKRKSFHVFGENKYMEALAPFAETKLNILYTGAYGKARE